ncbi:MAG: 5-oxoprolinase subunit PxpB [Trueperaceae bacterium]
MKRTVDAPAARGFYLHDDDSEAHGLAPYEVGNALLRAVTDYASQGEAAAAVLDVIPAYDSLYVEYDAGVVDEARMRLFVEAAIARRDREQDGGEVAQGTRPANGAGAPRQPRLVTIPVAYGGECGIDLGAVAAHLGLSPDEVIEIHAGTRYRVAAVGFAPGFPFLAEVPARIRVPRHAAPRTLVPAHSVAIANQQTGIYPLASPGGWNVIGRSLVAVYDPHRDEPFLLAPGDEARFEPAEGTPPPEPTPLELLPASPRLPRLRVEAPGLLDLVLDAGRFLVGRFGLARSGPLDAPLARLANRLVANRPDAPLLEMTLTGPTLEALADTVVAVTGEALVPMVDGEAREPFCGFALGRGQRLSFAPAQRGCRSYLALAGGIEATAFLGSVSADLRGRIGRPLVAGDVLGASRETNAVPGRAFVPHRHARDPEFARLLPGPQVTPEALRALTDQAFEVGRADRTGMHLVGPEVPGGEITSEAVPLGAVQVTRAGAPIILLNDRGTLGGYAKPAVVHPADLARLAQLRVGARVRFVMAKR